MQKVLQKLSVILVLALIVVSSGFTMYKHYCGGDLQIIHFNKEASTCHDMASSIEPPCHGTIHDTPTCHNNENSRENHPDDCCENEVSWQQVDQYVIQDVVALDLPVVVSALVIAVPRWLQADANVHIIPLLYGHPPPLLAHHTDAAGLQIFRL